MGAGEGRRTKCRRKFTRRADRVQGQPRRHRRSSRGSCPIRIVSGGKGCCRSNPKFRPFSDHQRPQRLPGCDGLGVPGRGWRARFKLIETIANDLLQRKSTSGSTRYPRRRWLWAARGGASETSSGQPQSRLNISDLSVEGLKPGDILTRSDGVIETKPIPFSQLKSISVSTRGNLDARGTLTIEGLLARPAPANRLPVGAVRRRFFNIETGKEINVARDAIDVGQELLVVCREVTIKSCRKAMPLVQPDSSPPEGNNSPLLIADLLPSAFQVISSTPFEQSGIVLHGDAAQLKPARQSSLR